MCRVLCVVGKYRVKSYRNRERDRERGRCSFASDDLNMHRILKFPNMYSEVLESDACSDHPVQELVSIWLLICLLLSKERERERGREGERERER